MDHSKKCAFLLATLLCCGLNPSFAAGLTRDEVLRVVSAARVLDPKYQLNVGVTGDEVTVTTYQNQSAKDVNRDCKIDAILVAKALYDKFGSALPVVKLMFFDTRDRSKYKTVSVRPGDIRTFATGGLTQESLLSILTVVTGSYAAARPAASPDLQMAVTQVRQGPFYDDRVSLLAKINGARKDGLHVGPIMQSYKELDDLVAQVGVSPSQGQLSQVTTKYNEVTTLVNRLSDQRNAVNTAAYNRKIMDIPAEGIEVRLRQDVYERLNRAESAGVDVTDLKNSYKQLEQRIAQGLVDAYVARRGLLILQGELQKRNPQ